MYVDFTIRVRGRTFSNMTLPLVSKTLIYEKIQTHFVPSPTTNASQPIARRLCKLLHFAQIWYVVAREGKKGNHIIRYDCAVVPIEIEQDVAEQKCERLRHQAHHILPHSPTVKYDADLQRAHVFLSYLSCWRKARIRRAQQLGTRSILKFGGPKSFPQHPFTK
jgi:hypothetical protein